MSIASIQPPLAVAPRRVTVRRPALPTAHGEPAIWIMGSALAIALAMIAGIFLMIVVQGSRTFWPRSIHELTLASGQTVLGVRIERDDDGARTLYHVGNRDTGQSPFRWVPDTDVKSDTLPPDVVFLERTDWGPWLGRVQSVVKLNDGGRVVEAEGGSALPALQAAQPRGAAEAARLESMTRDELGGINQRMEDERARVKKADLALARASVARAPWLRHPASWISILAASVGLFALSWLMRWIKPVNRYQRAVYMASRAACGIAGSALLLLAVLEGPLAQNRLTRERRDAIAAAADTHIALLQVEYNAAQQRIEAARRENAALRVIVTEPTTQRAAPARQSTPDDPLMVAQVVRIVPANAISTPGKLMVYSSRWWEYVSASPRASNTESGVFPVIFGTVTLTLLLAITVVPLGVVAALYLREYARQGLMVSLIRIAVNNLAGVPSVVYGVFGLGFFAYAVGAYIDAGPTKPAGRGGWWMGVMAIGLAATLALAMGVFARGIADPAWRRRVHTLIGLCWMAAVGLALWAVAFSPYFGGFFAERLPTSTFGSRGILWAALTLALLTLPVVIVATEEAIAAVPRSVREGSYGCGASKWQTVRRVVLPQALPGIMTGAILAMARGAGEVAPLMLVGAVKSAPDLPVDGHFPFIHAERSFMHLGFHIFDLGFQSPDSQAARPLVWTTALLLVLIVLALNLTAVMIRARLRARVINASV